MRLDPAHRRRYAILDRDGTIIVEKNYLKSIEQLELLPTAAAGLRALADVGMGLIVITNQSGIGRGLMTVADVEAIHAELKLRLEHEGVRIEQIYYCPHSPAEDCSCRKPLTELATKAASEFGFSLQESVFIGDKESDVEFGRNCGARTILVRTGYGSRYTPTTKADAIAGDLPDAARIYSMSTWK